jgi:hypothetical protein
MSEKKVPYPYGKLGSPKHREKVDEVVEEETLKGFKAIKEYLLNLFGGKKRYMDVAVLDSKDDPISYHQIGKQTKNRLPVKRERDVIEEVYQDKGILPKFHPYNEIKSEKDNEK